MFGHKKGQSKEDEANRFARALLMPKPWFLKAIDDGLTVRQMAAVFDVQVRRVLERYADCDLEHPRDVGLSGVEFAYNERLLVSRRA